MAKPRAEAGRETAKPRGKAGRDVAKPRAKASRASASPRASGSRVHGASASPTPQRLERGAGPERVFWEISRTKATITTRFGRHLSAGRTVERRLSSDRDAALAMAKMIADKRGDGYADPPQRLAPGAASVRGVSVRNSELEALIDEAPHDPEGYLVYADWLQQQGDARGELIVIQHGLARDPDNAALERAESTLLKTFEAELLGTLAKYTHIRTAHRSHRGLAWRNGFIYAARLRRVAETPVSHVVRMLLEHPSGRFLARLAIGRTSYGNQGEQDLGQVFQVLATHAPRTLDWLLVGDGTYVEGTDVGPVWTALPRLRSLVLAGENPRFGTVRADALEELIVAWAGHDEIAAIARAQWPRLRRLALTLTAPATSAAGSLAPLLSSTELSTLADLSVACWMTTGDDPRLVPQDEIALELLRLAARQGLQRLELHMPLTEAGAKAILAERGLLAIGSVAMLEEALASAPLRAALRESMPNVSWTETPDDAALADLEGLPR